MCIRDRPYYYQTLLRSMVVCFSTVLTTTLVGVPIAYLITRYNIPCLLYTSRCV